MGEQRTALILLLIFGFAWISIRNLGIVQAESADYVRYSSGTTIYSPLPDTTYSSRFLNLNLTFDKGAGIDCSLNYSIDGNYNGFIPLIAENCTGFHIIYETTGFVTLPELSEGLHHLTINVLCGLDDYHGVNPPGAPFKPTSPDSSDYIATWIHTIYFRIDTTIPEFPSWIIIPIILTSTLVIISIRTRLKKKGLE